MEHKNVNQNSLPNSDSWIYARVFNLVSIFDSISVNKFLKHWVRLTKLLRHFKYYDDEKNIMSE